MRTVDASVWLGPWPFGFLEPATATALAAHQAALGIEHSLVAPLAAVFHPTPAAANEQLLAALADHPTLEPVLVVNPAVADWPREVARAAAAPRVRQLRLVPNYHGYLLDDARVDQLLAAAAAAGLRVSVQVRLEDERAHYPLLQVPGVPVAEIIALAARHPATVLLALCAYRHEALALAASRNVLVDLSHVEVLDTVDDTLRQASADQLVFGSHTPFLVTAAALAKVDQSRAGAEALTALRAGNVDRWLAA